MIGFIDAVRDLNGDGPVDILFTNGVEYTLRDITTFIDDGFIWGHGFLTNGKPLLFNVATVATVRRHE